ncbi:sporulation protein YtxC [Desulfofarcimen acetoxidans DSM 771]|jgi:putative sporulation protein YtxC|uniref:Sporulation protein YtxC n=1 Tax=Desulfofarcimen acetoxidans (strain ATCC 49208 / DSM 771 / KCTC 5769 / VKM B-1644 / 5575) TaxID=485916 RepID=C8W0F9_DESAS|nr:putative sporulation protein YtxC [Desulfofarcimen acetoxidans]ACV63214.1 sporulation protein YtxC [Desulfofarcimen acetoxidans DSM 771]
MAQGISISATQHIDLLKSKLGRELRLLENEGIDIEFKEKPTGDYKYLNCYIKDSGDTSSQKDYRSIFSYYVADVISDLILGYWESYIIKKIILESYYYFEEEERNTILNYTLGLTNNTAEISEVDFHKLRRKTKILNKLMEYLKNNDRINIDGFIRFRLKDYMEELYDMVEKAVDEFMMEREYKEFIQLLRYFVDIQESRLEMVHVIVLNSGVFKLLDEKQKVINSEFLEGYVMDLIDSEINYEDLLISALISIAPQKIVFHRMDDNSAFNSLTTLKNVFTGKVQECSGCDICAQYRQ